MKFGEKLIQLRKRNGLSQEELGEKLNVTRQTVSKWELGQSKPDTDKLMEIGKLFNVDFNALADDNLKIDGTKPVKVVDSDEVRPRKWLLILLIIVAIIIVIVLANKYVMDKKEQEKNQTGIFDIFKGFNEMVDLDSVDKSSFNRQYEISAGTKMGSSVSRLLDDIITNNKTNDEHIITVVYKDFNSNEPNKIKDLKRELETFENYEVSLDYDENGYVYMVTIEEINKDDTNQSESNSDNSDTNIFNESDKKTFNMNFEFYAGTNKGTFVVSLLDKVITNNKTEPNHIIKIIYNNMNTTNEDEIRNIKKDFDTWTDYEVILDYDGNGYVSAITIK